MTDQERPIELPIDDTGHRLANINFHVTGDGQHTILTFGIVDRSTKASLPSPRFFTDYEGLSLLIATLHSAARASADNLVKSGAAAAFTMALRKIVVTHIQSFAVGISTNRTTVSMQIQTMEGPLSSFAADPQTARKLAEYLTEAADQLKSPSSLN